MVTKKYSPSRATKLTKLNLKPGHIIKADEFNNYIRTLATQLNRLDEYTARIYQLLGGELPDSIYDFSQDEDPFVLPGYAENIISAIEKGGDSVWVGESIPTEKGYKAWIQPIVSSPLPQEVDELRKTQEHSIASLPEQVKQIDSTNLPEIEKLTVSSFAETDLINLQIQAQELPELTNTTSSLPIKELSKDLEPLNLQELDRTPTPLNLPEL